MLIETTIWKHDPYTVTVRQVVDGSMRITEKTVDKTINDISDSIPDKIQQPPPASKPKKTSGLVVDVFGMKWKEKVDKIKEVMDDNGIISSEVNFLRSVVRKETPACPDNFMVAVKVGTETIYEANGKFSVKRMIEKMKEN